MGDYGVGGGARGRAVLHEVRTIHYIVVCPLAVFAILIVTT